MIYCQRCGLWMSNGFCLHINVDDLKRRADEQAKGDRR